MLSGYSSNMVCPIIDLACYNRVTEAMLEAIVALFLVFVNVTPVVMWF
jgi:hypothetical protein